MISVVIPLYNKEAIIKKSLYSVLTQDYDDFEVVVVNDGSTDKSAEIVKSIHDARITLIEQENGGPSKARNVGVKNAKGEWILFLDADDELLPNSLKQYSEGIKKAEEANVIVSPFYNYDGKECTLMFPYKEGNIKNPMKKNFFGGLLPRTGAFVYTKNIALKYPFNEKIRRFEDLDVLLRLYSTARIYATSQPSMKVNGMYALASNKRKSISEDFLGYLDFKGKSFWEYMSLYKFYLEERERYPEEVKKLYPNLHRRYDLLILYKLLLLLHKIHVL